MKHLCTHTLGALALLVGTASAAEVTLQNAFPSLPAFSYPVDLQDPMDGTDRLFMVEHPGRIWVFNHDPAVNTRTLFLDLTANINNTWDCGLLGLAFDPDYENNGVFYAYYTPAGAVRARLSRFHVSANPNVADPASEQPLFEIPQVTFCHKAGCLVFGPDGYLYITVGEDCSGTPAQDLTSLKGKLLRIDVNVESPDTYTIPPDNPFVGNPNGWREEIYAYGFRNPWQFSIDPETERIWLGDVGEAKWEEVNIIKKGRNYGWIKMEGFECYPNPAACDTAGRNIVLPITVFPHGSEMGESVTGGYVYRGHTLPRLWGKYIYGDYVNGVIWALSYDGVTATNDEIYNVPPTKYISTFAVDKDDEVYVVSLYGYIYRMIDVVTTGVGGSVPTVPELTGGPNPFQSSTTWTFDVPAGDAARIEVYDVRGRRVRVLASSASSDARSVTWSGTDDAGQELASGVYFARLLIEGRVMANQRVVLVR
jgi:glucose/arabinose dehydrogenase